MNRTSETIHCKPSQLLNLRYLPGVLAAVALLFIPKAFLTEIIPVAVEIGNGPDFSAVMQGISCNGVADCLDNYRSRFVMEEHLPAGSFMVHGGVNGDFGQITTIVKDRTVSLAGLYEGCSDGPDPIPMCPQIVISIGSFMALEVIRNLWGEPSLLNTLLVIELSDFSMFRIPLT